MKLDLLNGLKFSQPSERYGQYLGVDLLSTQATDEFIEQNKNFWRFSQETTGLHADGGQY